jgi:predicted dehydrogenase
LGSILVSDAAPSPWSYEMTSGENAIYPQTGQDCYYLCGTQAALAFPSMTLWRHADGQEPGWYHPLQRDRLSVEDADPLAAQLAHFCRVIRGEERPLIDGWDALRTLAATLAVLESARRNTPVRPGDLT